MTLHACMHGAGKPAIRRIVVLLLFVLALSGCDRSAPLLLVKAVAAGAPSLTPFFDERSGLGHDARGVRPRTVHGSPRQGGKPDLYGGTPGLYGGTDIGVPPSGQCGQRHGQWSHWQVLGLTRLGNDVTLAPARTRSETACAKDVPPRDYGLDPSLCTSGSWTSAGA
jgi:hypothetical protein